MRADLTAHDLLADLEAQAGMSEGPEDDRPPTSVPSARCGFCFALRSEGVTDTRVLTAMEKVDRGVFVQRPVCRPRL